MSSKLQPFMHPVFCSLFYAPVHFFHQGVRDCKM